MGLHPFYRFARPAIAMLSIGLAACSANVSDLGNIGGANGEDGVAGAIAQGIFRDSNVGGLKYESLDQSGVSATDGTFKYIVGTNVSFWVGAVSLGTTPAKPVVTPLDLVTSGTTSSNKVLNIARFLMYLDKDDNADNDIAISQKVQDLAEGWPAELDFDVTPADFDTTLTTATSIPTDLAGISGETHVLPTSTEARTHLRTMLLCTYQGAFGGSYTGDVDSGNLAVYLDPKTGVANGYTYGANLSISTLTGDAGINFDTYLPDVSLSNTAQSRVFNFQFSGLNVIAGHWSADNNGAETNTLNATRIGADQTLHIHFAGRYSSQDRSDAGVMAFNIDRFQQDDISVSGEIYSVVANTTQTFQGRLIPSGTTQYQIDAQSGDNRFFSGLINASTLEFSGPVSTGNDPNNRQQIGTYSGSGCGF
jgi:hypothetical protein